MASARLPAATATATAPSTSSLSLSTGASLTAFLLSDCSYIAGSYGECSATCGPGYRKRSIYIVSEPVNGGTACPVDLFQREACQGPPCPIPRDCVVEWGRWSFCSRTCDGGSQTISGEITTFAQYGGAACPRDHELTLTRSCGNTPCPLAPPTCEIVQGVQSACSVSCGGGFAYARAYIKTDAPDCPPDSSLFTQVECNTQPCPSPLDCEVRRSYWGECSQPCGGGIQTRTLEILRHATNGGIPCPTTNHETRSCNTDPCHGGLRYPQGSHAPIAGSQVPLGRRQFFGSGSRAQATSQSFGGFGGSGSRAGASSSSFGRGGFSGRRAQAGASSFGFGK